MISSTLPAGLTAAQPNNAKGGGNMGQAEFLQLMTAQLKFQDPFDPVDNSAMVAQMAQFSQVAGIAEMNTSLKGISAAFNATRLSEASQFIGKSVLAESEQVGIDYGGVYRGEVTLAGDTENLTIELVDESGAVVKSISGPAEKGVVPFGFVSTDEDGKPVDLGPLKIRIAGGVATSTAAWLPVTAVNSTATGTHLTTTAGPIDLNTVRGVS